MLCITVAPILRRCSTNLTSIINRHAMSRRVHDLCRVVVTGMGIVCPLGVGVERVWHRLRNGECGITSVVGDGYESIPCKVAAYVPKHELLLETTFTASELRTIPMSSLYCLVCAEQALDDAQWRPSKERHQKETGVAVGMGMIDLAQVVDSANTFFNAGYSKLSPHFVTKILVNMPAGHISMRYGLRGPNHSVSTACATGAHAIGDAFNFIQRGSANVMVCGGTESVINPLSMASFAKIRALCTKFNDNPSKASRPFDSQRCGFVMGEGCGLIVLEELSHALHRNANIYAEVLGYGLSGDAHHITAPREDGNGALECMKAAVDDAHIRMSDITHINTHATSTPLGDKAELTAIKELFGDEHYHRIAITSTKGSTGHLLGAAGSVEAIFTILSCYNGVIPPTINLEEPLDSEANIVGNDEKKWETERRIAITNSFGFGGTNSSLVISNYLL